MLFLNGCQKHVVPRFVYSQAFELAEESSYFFTLKDLHRDESVSKLALWLESSCLRSVVATLLTFTNFLRVGSKNSVL